MTTGVELVLGVTGGIAAYKAAALTSMLHKAGHNVSVIMTRNARNFVAPLTFETLSGNPVICDTFDRPRTWEVEHVALAERARLMIIAPATANIIAKLSIGLADDMLSTTALATRAPLVIAPAMNTGMWEAEPTQHNMAVLRARGAYIVGPGSGRLACGSVGAGRMAEPEEIFEEIQRLLRADQALSGIHVLVTAGPTREDIDPVRYISNRSSGKMGYAIAEEAARRGAAVTLVSGPVALTPPRGVDVVSVKSTRDLLDAMLARCDGQDIIVQAAAPADFTPDQVADEKIKKAAGEGLTLSLIQTPDVARAVGARKRPGQVLVGFAAETNRVYENAVHKLKAKALDMIVANDVTRPGAGFDVDTNIATLVTEKQTDELPLMSKRELAAHILDRAQALWKEKSDVR